MSVVYVCEQGAVIKRSGHRLIVDNGGATILDMPVIKIDSLFLFGNVQLTTQAIALLFENNIDVVYFSSRGRLRGRLASTLSKNVEMRIAQGDQWRDEAYKLQFARRMVRTKLNNMSYVLGRYRYNHPDAVFTKKLEAIERGIARLDSKRDIAGIMGIEGVCSSAYFSCYGQMFRRELQFTGRAMHPSPDPINALLSLGYMLVVNELASLLEGNALDPFLGFMHGIKYGRKSLALDMVEQFRQPLVDQFTLFLANLKIYNENDFESIPGEGVHLKDEPFRDYLARYEGRLGIKVAVSGNKRMAWRDLFRHQVEQLASAILDGTEYEPYTAE